MTVILAIEVLLMKRILVVDDDRTLRENLARELVSHGYEVHLAENGRDAVERVRNLEFSAVFLDVNMPVMNGIEALQEIKTISPETFCLMLTAYSDVKDAVTAIKYGAFDYLEKPIEIERLISLMAKAEAAESLVSDLQMSSPTIQFSEGREIVGSSAGIRKVFDVICKLAKVDTSVLIRGESGTGKELVARALHFNSQRKNGPFLAVNCAAIPEGLIESELFGHEKGAFTGADKKKIGKFQMAQGGTLFLDEIGDISPAVQVKLLRALQERVVMPVGSATETSIDCRIISATHRSLEDMIKTEKFRADLFYRLNILPIHLPALRERREDLRHLVEFIIKRFNKLHGRQIKGLNSRAFELVSQYSWPGNIRELENAIERAFILEPSEIICEDSLPEHIGGVTESIGDERKGATTEPDFEFEPLKEGSSSVLNFPELKEQFEREFIMKALRAYGGRINRTADATKMTKVTLLRKLERYGIDPKEYHH